VIAASFGKIAMRREDEAGRGPMFLWRYLSALLRHYEEGFWLVVLAIVSLPCFQFVFDRLGVVSFAEARAASTAMCGSYRAHDVALSLLRMVSNNIGHIATLSAQQCGLRHIVFGGSFIRDHPYTISTISSAVRFFSRGIVQALFLKHDGFVGAIGTHMRGNALAGAVERIGPPPLPCDVDALKPPKPVLPERQHAQTFSEMLPSVAGAPRRGERTQLFTEQLIPPPDPQIVVPGSRTPLRPSPPAQPQLAAAKPRLSLPQATQQADES